MSQKSNNLACSPPCINPEKYVGTESNHILCKFASYPLLTKHLWWDEQAGEKYKQTKHLGMGRKDRWKKIKEK